MHSSMLARRARRPPEPAALRRIAGYGTSPVVRYDGEGVYFLDKVRPGVWRLEVYPDAVPVRDPFEPPNAAKVVTRSISRAWPMTLVLPDLGGAFTVQPVDSRQPADRSGRGRAIRCDPRRLCVELERTGRRRHITADERLAGLRRVSRATGRHAASVGAITGRARVPDRARGGCSRCVLLIMRRQTR